MATTLIIKPITGSALKSNILELRKAASNTIAILTVLLTTSTVLNSFSGLLYNLYGGQIEEDLCQDSWMGYLNTPTPFVGNVNNTTYYIRWNAYWGRVYGSVMSPSKQVIRLAKENDLPLFATWAKLIRVLSISKLTAIHGPVIYTNYGSTANSILYDKESDLYNLFFAQLDSIQTDFAANKDYKGFAKFDGSYSGNIGSWMKVVNSLRLRLAMRLSVRATTSGLLRTASASAC